MGSAFCRQGVFYLSSMGIGLLLQATKEGAGYALRLDASGAVCPVGTGVCAEGECEWRRVLCAGWGTR